MKTFLILVFFCFCSVFSVNAQDKTYTPNARQAIQKSRMQQPQYMNLTKEPDSVDQQSAEEVPAHRSTNYLLERPVAIDAPKRRGKKSNPYSFAKLANYTKK